MSDTLLNLAVETSSRRGRVALGRGAEVLEIAELPAARRHNLDLVPSIDALLRGRDAGPADLGELYVSLGPGSFTGLRIAVATAKMLSLTVGLRIVGVPTLELLAVQHPGSMVCLNVKQGTAWSTGPGHPPAFRSLEQLRDSGLPLIADTLEDAAPAEPDVAVLYRLGHAAAQAGRYDDPLSLAPLYLREPEAVTLWDQRHGPPSP